jgi:ribosomal protein S21
MGNVSPVRIGSAMLLGGAASLGLVALTLFWRRRPPPGNPVERAFRRFAERVGRAGLGREPSETPTAYLMRVCAACGRLPEQATPLVEEIERLLYNPPAAGAGAELRRLKRGLRRLTMDATLRARG